MKQNEQKKILGEERRQLILQWLLAANEPLSGNELSKKTNVSRQVIVQDI
ncbi:TPA: HTH domain-containing protein, partial [Bacillus anthracis]|nr:HTH domain-containing protein [Bacillus anthracis]